MPRPVARRRRVAPAARACVLAGLLAAGTAACATGGLAAAGSPAPSPSGTAGTGGPAAAGTGSAPPASPSASPSQRRSSGTGKPLAGKVIVIDPGHNGDNWAHPEIINRLVNVITERKACDTTGTSTDAGYTEHAFTFNVSVRLVRLLRADGAKVVLTRHNDHGVGPCVTQRAAIGNRAHADVAISVHADGGPPGGTGFEVIEPGLVPGHTNAIMSPSGRLGLDIRNAYHRVTGEPYSDYIGHRGLDVRTDLGGLNLSKIPKVFIECANMRNAADAARLTSPAFRQRIAAGLAEGLTAFLTHGG